MNRALLILLLISAVSAQQTVRPNVATDKTAFRRALKYERSNQTDEAIKIYRELLEVNPKNSRAYSQLKSLFRRLKKYEDLELLIQTRLETYPQDIQSMAELGEVYLLMGDESAAVDHWEQIIAENQSSKTGYRVVLQEYIRHGMENRMDKLVSEGREAFGEADLFSLELAGFYSRKQNFSKATNEYLTYLQFNPKQFKSVSRQLLRMSDDAESHEEIEAKLSSRLESGNSSVKMLYADFLFKIGRHSDAVQQHRDMGTSSESDLNRWLTLAGNLRKEVELSLASDAYITVLRSLPHDVSQRLTLRQRKIMGEALYGLAMTSELQIAPTENVRSLADYFPDNQFFRNPFVSRSSIVTESLQETFALYDSILTTLPATTFSPQAHFRLGEIKYRITRDFDGALTSFRAAETGTDNRALNLAATSRLADVLIAKGDPESALNILNDKIASLPDRQQDDLKVKRCYVLLLSGAIDSAEYNLTELVNNLTVKDDAFNDVLELKGFVDEHFSSTNEEGKEAFRYYISAELLLRQAKKTEAQALFRQAAEQYPDVPIAHECLFRAAEIDQQLGRYEGAITAFSELSTGDWGDRASTRIAEIYDLELADSENALTWYLTVLNEYENSLLAEPVRYRIRELTKEQELN